MSDGTGSDGILLGLGTGAAVGSLLQAVSSSKVSHLELGGTPLSSFLFVPLTI